jgi:hypothetical protein
MGRRFWTRAETQYVIDHYASQTACEIASQLGRTDKAVYQHAFSLGLTDKRSADEIEKRDVEILRLHKLGWSAGEMESRVGINQRTIRSRINKMGHTPNGRNARYRRRVAANTRKQCQEAGVANLAELRVLEYKRVAKRYGWPDHLSIRSVQIVETLYRQGPMTRKQLAVAIGMHWIGSRKTFRGRVPGGSYLAELQRAGLVVRLESAITHKGKGNHEDLYMVGLGVEPCRKTKSLSQSQT